MPASLSKRIRLTLTLTLTALLSAHASVCYAQGADAAANGANRLLFWVGASEVAGLGADQLDLWRSRGVGGFICLNQHLYGMGGVRKFTGDPNADLNAPGYELQRAFRDSGVVAQAKARGMKMYLGFWLVNYFNRATPLKDWFDDAGWRNDVLPRVREVAAAARLLGFDGLAFDQELYPQVGGVAAARWAWDYPGNTHAEAEVRAKARQRGRELMQAVLEVFPQVEIVAYDTQFPETWQALVQKKVNNLDNYAADLLFPEFWDGLSGVEGYGAIRFLNAIFYKTPHVGSWETAFQYEFNTHQALLSRRFSNWAYASSRVYNSPFSWIDGNVAGEGAFTAPRPPDYVAAQLAAFKKWGMGGTIANYSYSGLSRFDYSPYFDAMRSAAAPSVADDQSPRLSVAAPAVASLETDRGALDLAGAAFDNLAIRAVRWKNDRGGEGAAAMTWRVNAGDYSVGYDWQMDWSAGGVPLQPGENRVTVTAEDIKGLTASQTLTVWRSAPNPIETSQGFVTQHYRDFLSRDPDAPGLAFWTGEIESCGADLQCREVKRISVSAAFFLSIEFQETGFLSYRARKAAFGDLAGKPVPLTREEMLQDVQVLGAGLVVNAEGWQQRLEQNKQAYFEQLAASARFTTLYPQALTPEQFVDALNANAGGALSQAEHDALVNDLKGGVKTRAQVLRAVAEDADLTKAEFNKAFVLMQYFGYLRRDPDAAPDTDFSGYSFWLSKLEQFNGDFVAAEMVKAFINSIEYRQRFGP